MANKDLGNARKAKKDEFYTQLVDIELEMKNYKPHFRDKVIFCNCDDPYESNFFKHFVMHFNDYGIRKLIATCYNGSPVANTELSLFPIETTKSAYKIELTEMKDYNNDGAIDLDDVEYFLQQNPPVQLQGTGDFRSPECIELLKQADIVVTNPPFSLFREYIAQLVKYDKKFVIVGNTNALSYREVFQLFQQDKIRTGYTNFNVGMFFYVPDSFELFHHYENGKKVARVSASCWYTNLPVSKHNEELQLFRKYTPEAYPKYDNFDAINVDKYTEIPKDYDGIMGVPITFLDKYNPQQFEIIGAMTTTKIDDFNFGYPYVNGNKIYARILIRRKH